jgi:hypothetical protein
MVRTTMPYLNRGFAAVRAIAFVAGAMVLAAPLLADTRLTKQDGTRFQSKLAAITQFGSTPARDGQTRTTQVTDVEVNSYFKYVAPSQIPVGIVEPTLNAMGNGRVSGRALVDLDAVRKQKKRGWMDPLGYLSGLLPVTASGILTTQNGVGNFKLESAEISGVSVPKSLLQELLSYYSRTPQNPAGINMDDPFELPARIREIRVAQGAATIVQ